MLVSRSGYKGFFCALVAFASLAAYAVQANQQTSYSCKLTNSNAQLPLTQTPYCSQGGIVSCPILGPAVCSNGGVAMPDSREMCDGNVICRPADPTPIFYCGENTINPPPCDNGAETQCGTDEKPTCALDRNGVGGFVFPAGQGCYPPRRLSCKVKTTPTEAFL